MNALKVKIFSVAIAAGLAAGAAFAASASTVVAITLPEAVTLGSTTLSAGQYQVTEGSGDVVVFRSNNGEVAATMATKSLDAAPDQKTEVVLTHEGGALHLDKLFIAGENAGYQFPESK